METFWPRFVLGVEALPLRRVLREMNLHLMERKVRAPYFGFQVGKDGNGPFVARLDRGGPAARAGLRLGDRLLEEVALHILSERPIRVRVARGGSFVTITVQPAQGQRIDYRLNPLGEQSDLKYMQLLR